jgi:hypothetical protein
VSTADIDIATVLKKIDDTYDEQTHEEKFYGLAFIDAHGNKHWVEVRKNVISPRQKRLSKNPRGKSEFNYQRRGIVQVRQRDASHPITPKACMIFQFKDFKSTTWLNVFH